MGNEIVILAGALILYVLVYNLGGRKKHSEPAVKNYSLIQHTKQEYLATRNEQKLYFALQKALDSKYHIHCQTSLIAIVEPIEFKHKKRAYSKRMDFVITDSATKIVAVIELDDSSHNKPKRIERDKYVNAALKPHYPLIRISTQKFYNPEDIAERLENSAGIKNIFKSAMSLEEINL